MILLEGLAGIVSATSRTMDNVGTTWFRWYQRSRYHHQQNPSTITTILTTIIAATIFITINLVGPPSNHTIVIATMCTTVVTMLSIHNYQNIVRRNGLEHCPGERHTDLTPFFVATHDLIHQGVICTPSRVTLNAATQADPLLSHSATKQRISNRIATDML